MKYKTQSLLFSIKKIQREGDWPQPSLIIVIKLRPVWWVDGRSS